MSNKFYVLTSIVVLASILIPILIYYLFKLKAERDKFDSMVNSIGLSNGIQMAVGVNVWHGKWKDHDATAALGQSYSKINSVKGGGVILSIYSDKILNKHVAVYLKGQKPIYIGGDQPYISSRLSDDLIKGLMNFPHARLLSGQNFPSMGASEKQESLGAGVKEGFCLSCIIDRSSDADKISSTLDEMVNWLGKF